jgi:hypothetical protein
VGIQIECVSHNEELCNLYRIFHVVTVVKCRNLQCAGYGARRIQHCGAVIYVRHLVLLRQEN